MATYFTDIDTNTSHKIGTVYNGNIKIGQIYKGYKLVYQSAFRITYVIDKDREYVEKVVPKKSILSPTTFTPTKEGWTFVGWNTNKDATTGLTSYKMPAENKTLYAIFRKEAIKQSVSWNSNGATLSSTANSECTIPAVYNNQKQKTQPQNQKQNPTQHTHHNTHTQTTQQTPNQPKPETEDKP